MSFTDKVVIVTGSGSGIGAATALTFAKEGARIVIVGLNEEKMKQVGSKCESLAKKPLVMVADISKDNEAKKIIDETIKKFGKLDVLVNNAGIVLPDDITSDNFMEGYDRVMNINLRAPVYLTHLAIPHLIKTKGNIINISSVAATSTSLAPTMLSYYISKAALNHFSRGVALKLAEHGVRVNIVSPATVRTDILVKSSTPLTWDIYENSNPLKRISEPQEIADLILFLANEKARGITGSEFVSDNGSLLVM